MAHAIGWQLCSVHGRRIIPATCDACRLIAITTEHARYDEPASFVVFKGHAVGPTEVSTGTFEDRVLERFIEHTVDDVFAKLGSVRPSYASPFAARASPPRFDLIEWPKASR